MSATTFPLVPAIAATAAVGTIWLTHKASKIGRRQDGLPPGPPTTPLLGNLADFPKDKPWIQISKWAEEYGDIYSLKVGAGTVVVLTSAAAIREVLEKGYNETSDRPGYYIANQVLEGMHIGAMRYGERWKKVRYVCRDITTPAAANRTLPIQQAEATQLMYDLVTHPIGFRNSISRYATSSLMSVIYGKRIPRSETREVQEFFETEHMWQDLIDPSSHPPVDLIPILKYVPEPFASWKSLVKEIKKRRLEYYHNLTNQVESRLASGETIGCWMESILSGDHGTDFSRDQIAWIGGSLLEAGYDNIAASILWLILALISFPEVQKKAQEEIDRVVGRDRVPTLDDLERLPYVRAVIKENNRFRPTAPLSVAHATTTDVSYKGYVIPTGATIFPNIWGVFHDEKVFEDPEVFNPDRFIKHPYGLREELKEESQYWKDDIVFGSGRRMCTGLHLARNSMNINALNLLWGFSFSKANDPATGNVIEPDLFASTKGITVSPQPYACKITPRSPQHAALIQQELRNVTPIFDQFEGELTPEDKEFVTKQRRGL